MTTLIIILILGFLVEKNLRPRLEKNIDGRVLLWYGIETRKYIFII